MPTYLEIVVNVPHVEGVFHYHLPPKLEGRVLPGHLVEVPFGRQQVQGVVIKQVAQPSVTETKAVKGLIDDSVVVTILQSQTNRPQQFTPALTATFIETPDTLTVTVSDLDQGTVRGTISSIGSTVLDQGKTILSKRRRLGVAGMLDAAGRVMDGVEDLVEDIQDLGLPRRVWEVIDRVGEAAEQAYLDQKRKEQELQWQREAAEQAWTHCASCGRRYKDSENSRTDCPSCGAPRGDKPAWLK